MATQQSSRWPLAPLIIPPTSNIHKSTFIILHGRGSTANKFASPLLTHLVSSSKDVEEGSSQSYFPNSKFIFPTARLLRARAYNRSLTHQWFDAYPFGSHPPDYKSHIQIPGLRDSVRYVHELLKDAIQEVGAKNVVLMGLSQGCTAALVSMLLWQGEKLGAVVGMCGCLPFMKSLSEAMSARDKAGDEIDDIFERNPDDDNDSRTKIELAIDYLREELEMTDGGVNECSLSEGVERRLPTGIPIFLGHGVEDEKVPFEYGKETASLLKKMDLDVEWREYTNLGHWYSADMLRDIVTCLRNSQFEFRFLFLMPLKDDYLGLFLGYKNSCSIGTAYLPH